MRQFYYCADGHFSVPELMLGRAPGRKGREDLSKGVCNETIDSRRRNCCNTHGGAWCRRFHVVLDRSVFLIAKARDGGCLGNSEQHPGACAAIPATGRGGEYEPRKSVCDRTCIPERACQVHPDRLCRFGRTHISSIVPARDCG